MMPGYIEPICQCFVSGNIANRSNHHNLLMRKLETIRHACTIWEAHVMVMPPVTRTELARWQNIG
jgi:hypothetical protein